MRSLSLDQLRTLSEVAETGSFTAAARRLNLSQPAISLQIRELESRFGVRLIERMGKTAFPTEPGRVLIEHAALIASACDGASDAMRRYREGWVGRVRIGTTLTALMYSLPPLLRRLRAEHGGVELTVTNMATRDSVDAVLDNSLDLALVTLPVTDRRLRVTALRDEKLVAMLPATMADVPDVVTPAWTARQALVLEHDRGAVHRLVMAWLALHLPLAIRPMEIGTVEATKKGVASGLGLTLLPDVAAEPTAEVIIRPLQPEVPCTLGLIERRDKPDNPALAIVRAALMGLKDKASAKRAARPARARLKRDIGTVEQPHLSARIGALS